MTVGTSTRRWGGGMALLAAGCLMVSAHGLAHAASGQVNQAQRPIHNPQKFAKKLERRMGKALDKAHYFVALAKGAAEVMVPLNEPFWGGIQIDSHRLLGLVETLAKVNRDLRRAGADPVGAQLLDVERVKHQIEGITNSLRTTYHNAELGPGAAVKQVKYVLDGLDRELSALRSADLSSLEATSMVTAPSRIAPVNAFKLRRRLDNLLASSVAFEKDVPSRGPIDVLLHRPLFSAKRWSAEIGDWALRLDKINRALRQAILSPEGRDAVDMKQLKNATQGIGSRMNRRFLPRHKTRYGMEQIKFEIKSLKIGLEAMNANVAALDELQ